MGSLGRALGIVILVVAGVGACAMPAPLVRLEPRNPSAVTWVAGRAVLDDEAAGIRVAAAFEQQQGDLLGVRVEIENRGLSRIELSPRDVIFMTCTTPDNASCGPSRWVVDPELVIEDLDAAESRARAQATNEQALYTGLVLLSAVGDAASIASGRPHRTTGVGTVGLATRADAAAGRAETSSLRRASGRELWANHALRRTTLQPGGAASGLVYLPIRTEAQYIWLQVRAGGQDFPFAFKQHVRVLTSSPPAARRRR
jgi:hypothetical protein